MNTPHATQERFLFSFAYASVVKYVCAFLLLCFIASSKVAIENKKNASSFDGETSYRFQSLNGIWSITFFKSPLYIDESIYHSLDTSDWDTVVVPRSLETQGYGTLHYTDERLPFLLCKDEVPSINPTTLYVREFCVDDAQYILRFDGVETVYTIHFNGGYVEMSKGFRLAAKFDITPYM